MSNRLPIKALTQGLSGQSPPVRSVSTPRWWRRTLVLAGAGVLASTGLALLVLPGPGTLLLLAALALLGREFTWAQELSARMRSKARELAQQARGGGRNYTTETDKAGQ